MKKPDHLNISTARNIALAAQGLASHKRFGAGKAGTLAAIEWLGYIQIDTLSVVERAHLHVLWSRTGGHPAQDLQQLQWQDRKVFEYWAHAAAYWPMQSFRYAAAHMQQVQQTHHSWYESEANLRRQLMERISAEGPLKARDFKAPKGHKSSGWWQHKPAKRMLDALFLRGQLMISHREGFEKVYDLTERILPANVATSLPDVNEMAEYVIFSALRAHGLATQSEIVYALCHTHLFRNKPLLARIDALLPELIEAGRLLKFTLADQIVYLTPDNLVKPPRLSGLVHILSPFDNLVIQRRRLKWLFNYHYTLECYVPMRQRHFGYFCLPLLQRQRLIGRMDAKVFRQQKCLHIKALHLEADIQPTDNLLHELACAIHRFAVFNQATDVQLIATQPTNMYARLATMLAATA